MGKDWLRRVARLKRYISTGIASQLVSVQFSSVQFSSGVRPGAHKMNDGGMNPASNVLDLSKLRGCRV